MSTFGRSFPIEKITDQVLAENPWFTDMLLHWRPAGDAVHRDLSDAQRLVSNGHVSEEDPKRLRLAIRNGYFNFYRAGQSVAKIGFGSDGKLRAHVHSKYVDDKGDVQGYLILTSSGLYNTKGGGLREYDGDADLHRWIDNANQKAGGEKRFVDLIVARNPNTIDLEMALPAYLLAREERRAPRMDLVALEPAGDHWQIVFWEAKLVANGDARCRGEDVSPRVVDQLAQYTRWLDHDGHRDLVAFAYRDTCRLLLKFRELVKRINSEIEELGPGVVAAGSVCVPPLSVDPEPRLLIDDRTMNASFTEHNHLYKLHNKGLHVQMVHCTRQMTLEARH